MIQLSNHLKSDLAAHQVGQSDQYGKKQTLAVCAETGLALYQACLKMALNHFTQKCG